MRKYKLTLLLLLFCVQIQAQSNGNVYGIVRQNYYSTVTDPIDTNITYEQLDSSTIRFGYTDPAVGFVSNVNNTTYTQAVNLTGAALDPYQNTYIFMGGYGMNTFDINTGAITNQVALNNPLGFSYFDNFRFNNSDSSIYGLSRRDYYDPISNTTQQGVFLATVNAQTGNISEISTQAVAPGFTLSGSAIDPYQMVYYFAIGNNLLGLDLYNGSVYSNVTMSITDGFAFGNFTYSCADTGLYGLVRQNYFSFIVDPVFPGDSIEVLDSATIKLGKIDPTTGIVTTISPYPIANGAYTINGGAAIDPAQMIYYFSTGNAIVGVSLVTGLVTSNSTYQFANGEFFDLMRNFENCYSCSPRRQDPGLASVNEQTSGVKAQPYPNPFTNQLQLTNSNGTENYVLLNTLGEVIWMGKQIENHHFSNLANGFYYLKVDNTTYKLIKE